MNLILHKKLPPELRLPVLYRIHTEAGKEIRSKSKLNTFRRLLVLKTWTTHQKIVVESYISDEVKMQEDTFPNTHAGSGARDNMLPLSSNQINEFLPLQSGRNDKPSKREFRLAEGSLENNLSANATELSDLLNLNNKEISKLLACNPKAPGNVRLKAIAQVTNYSDNEILLAEKYAIVEKSIGLSLDNQELYLANKILNEIRQKQLNQLESYFITRTQDLYDLESKLFSKIRALIEDDLSIIKDYLNSELNSKYLSQTFYHSSIAKVLLSLRLVHQSKISKEKYLELNNKTEKKASGIQKDSQWLQFDIKMGGQENLHPFYYLALHSLRIIKGASLESILVSIARAQEIDKSFDLYLSRARKLREERLIREKLENDLRLKEIARRTKERKDRENNRAEELRKAGLREVGPGSFADRTKKGG